MGYARGATREGLPATRSAPTSGAGRARPVVGAGPPGSGSGSGWGPASDSAPATGPDRSGGRVRDRRRYHPPGPSVSAGANVKASILALTTPLGLRNVAIGVFLLASRMNACQTRDGPSSDVTSRPFGSEWSLLPIHTPTTSAGLSGDLGGARNPNVVKSRVSF